MNTNPSNTNSSKKRGSAKKGLEKKAKFNRLGRWAENTSRQRETMVKGRREICPPADDLYNKYGAAKKKGDSAVIEWRAALTQAYRGCKTYRLDTCDPDEVGDLMDILGELKVEEKQIQLEGGKMVGGNNPINHLFALNSWLARKQKWSTCANWFLTQIWGKFWELYVYLEDGIGDAIGIIKDVGFTALGHTDTETFKFTANAFSDLYSAVSRFGSEAALSAYPYFKAIEDDIKKILVENQRAIAAKIPDVVTPQQFQEWLNNTSMVNKIYWTLVTLKSYQATPLIAATLTTTGSIIMSASYYGVLIAYYITSSNISTAILLASAAGRSVYERLDHENKQRLTYLFDKFDKFMADMILGPDVNPLTSMMDEIKKLPKEAKLFALEKAKLQNELTKTILTKAEMNEELGKILQTEKIKAKIAEVEAETKQIQTQIESAKIEFEEEEDEKTAENLEIESAKIEFEEEEDEKTAENLEIDSADTPGADLGLGGKRRTRKRGKRHSKRAPRKTKTLRKKRRGKK